MLAAASLGGNSTAPGAEVAVVDAGDSDASAVAAAKAAQAGGARMIRQSSFTPKELARQIQVLSQRSGTLGNAAHKAWNCGRPDAVKDLADLVESFGGAEMMDVIRVGKNNARGASQGVAVGQGAARDAAEERVS